MMIAGASARAAAESAVREGMRVRCFDLFGDVDLRRVAEVTVVKNLQAELIDAALEIPAGCWMYTGALENQPRVVDSISQRHRLMGNAGDVLRRVRDPLLVYDSLRTGGLAALGVRGSNNSPPRDGGWLIKPLRSAAGRRIAIWDDAAVAINEPHYFQQRFVGTPIAAVFLASRLSCRLLGVTRQLVGETDLNAGPFAYCGSIGPLPLTPVLLGRIEAIGKRLADEFALRGVFGLDLLIDRHNVRLVEVNPRYPASAEVIEHATGIPIVPLHCLACSAFDDESNRQIANVEQEIATRLSAARPATRKPFVGKAILFAQQDLVAPELVPGEGALPLFADIPSPGTPIRAGEPICTLLTAGDNLVECLNDLIERGCQT